MAGGKRVLGEAGKREALAQEFGRARTLRQGSKSECRQIKLARNRIDVLWAQVSQLGRPRQARS
ncbi:hypothetical protein XH93_12050 [Bradyrhizobium sp. CCBAU 51753]|nr:hypothetical protein XH93_12050 [Bradyrhizobium sp. CCBAU 51753]